jgi:hypothetical protein
MCKYVRGIYFTSVSTIFPLDFRTGRVVVFPGYCGFLQHSNWPPRYNWNIVTSGVKHQKRKPTIDRSHAITIIVFHFIFLYTTFELLYHTMLCTSSWVEFELTTSVVISTDCIDSCKSNYHAITATTAHIYLCNQCLSPTKLCGSLQSQLYAYNINTINTWTQVTNGYIQHIWYRSNTATWVNEWSLKRKSKDWLARNPDYVSE